MNPLHATIEEFAFEGYTHMQAYKVSNLQLPHDPPALGYVLSNFEQLNSKRLLQRFIALMLDTLNAGLRAKP